MKKIRYTKLSPTSNMTILVETNIPVRIQKQLAKKIMSDGHIGGEQVGYIVPTANKIANYGLRMMSGEFCGNATLSLACWAMNRELPEAVAGDTKEYLLEVSGATDLITCVIEKEVKGYYGTVDMPLPNAIFEKKFTYRQKEYVLPVVEFKGISHIIFDEDFLGEASGQAVEEMAKLWSKEMGEVFGILLVSFDCDEFMEDDEDEYDDLMYTNIIPYVYSQDIGGIWENSCASGLSAVGCFLANHYSDDMNLKFKFPAGYMNLNIKYKDDNIKKVSIGGVVNLISEGIGYIE